MLDAYTNVFQVPGKRTTGDKAQTYVITGPNWKGTLPEGVKKLKSPTSMVWILGRPYCTGTPEDYKAVHDLQDKYKLVPLSAYGKEYTPPKGKVDPAIDMKTAVREQVNKMDAAAYFKLMAAHCTKIERIAMVGEKTWEKWMAAVCKPFTMAKIHYFDASQIDAAKGWLAEV